MAMKAAEAEPDPIDVLVGQRLRILRKQRGLSQSALAQAMGVTFQQVQKYERAINRISASMMVRAARALGVRPVDLLPPTMQAGAVPSLGDIIQTVIATRGSEELVQAYANISSARRRRALLRFARALADADQTDEGKAAA